jgi:starvation-inducible outer membrane lipoprotein
MKKIPLLCTLLFLSGCTSTSKPVNLKEIRKTTQEIRYTNDEIYNLWMSTPRWGKEFREL